MHSISNKNKHLTLQERMIIETGIKNGSTKKALADTLGKEKSTIGKEIKDKRILKYKCKLPLECASYKNCRYLRRCTLDCPDYKAFKCKRRDRSPGACNGCDKYQHCRFDKFFYDASIAHGDYKERLTTSREGFNTTTSEIKRIGNIIAPLIKNGQSIDQILMSHDEIKISSKTIYNYIAAGLFKNVGIDLGDLDLRRKVSRKTIKRRTNLYKPREDRFFIKGRTYKDYEAYMINHEDAKVTQLDTVYNKQEGPFIETFKFLRYGFLFGVFHKEKSKEAMNSGILILEDILNDLIHDEIDVLLTDRGSEFYGLYELEKKDGVNVFNVFYCDPMRSNQKGSLENKHEELRYILPKECDLYELGLISQEALNEVLSHINSSPRKKLGGKSPIELIKFFNPELWKRLESFGIKEIPKDEIILKPWLLKKFKK